MLKRWMEAVGLGWWVALLWSCAACACAGTLSHDDLVKFFPPPLEVGEKDHELAVWPILKNDLTSSTVVAYAFESIDLAPIPGFSGAPYDLLVMLGVDGRFQNVWVLSHHEPVFLHGLGEKPMLDFVDQYRNVSIQQSIKITSEKSHARTRDGVVYIDGVSKATASVRVLNQSLLASAVKVARAKLGYAGGREPDAIGKIRDDVYQPLDWAGLERAGLVRHKAFSNQEVERGFKGTAVEGIDDNAVSRPNDDFVRVYWVPLSVPSAGRSVLSEATWNYLQQRLDPGDQAYLLLWKGEYSLLSEDFVRGTVPDRVALLQENLPVEMRDLDLDTTLRIPPALQDYSWRVFRVIAPAGLDPSLPMEVEIHVTRSKGIVYPERVTREFRWGVEIPSDYVRAPPGDTRGWGNVWRERIVEIAVLAVALVLLGWQLLRPAILVRKPQRLRLARTAYLLFTVGFIGYEAQGQLSIVNLTAAIQAVMAGRSLQFFMFDPMTVMLWGFVLVTLWIWGRGTFCGWLCPFGALQELSAMITRRLGLRWRRVPRSVDRVLKYLKYFVLLAILAAAFTSAEWTDQLVEIEPFKTSITLNFVREWPYVIWAVSVVLLSSVYYKAYCRYLCPLGGGLALMGRIFRRKEWIARRGECGSPCQRCSSDCAYQAIRRDGSIDYEECFQCMDCVVIYENRALCVPLMQADKSATPARVIPIAVAYADTEPMKP